MYKNFRIENTRFLQPDHKVELLWNRLRTLPQLISLRWRILASLVLMTSLGVGILAYWVYQTTLEKEYSAVREKHLVVAQNLSASLSRYVQDVQQIYELAIQDTTLPSRNDQLRQSLSKFDLRYVAIISADNKISTESILATNEKTLRLPPEEIIKQLRQSAEEENGKIIFTGIRSFEGSPHFYILKALPNNQFALAPLKPDFITATQKSISFGKRGHSMIVDQDGRVIAHPNPKWQKISKDASKISVVKLMMSGQTGVAEFFSPPLSADMIAGYTVVPETGWGVMVPQPVQELREHAQEITYQAYIVSLFSISLALVLGWYIAGHLTHPLMEISTAATRLTAGEAGVRVQTPSNSSPSEVHFLCKAFNKMMDELDDKNATLSHALIKSEAGNQAKTDFLAMMSHEIRTPLNGVIGILDLLAESKIDTEQQQFIDVAVTSAEGLQKILNDFLDFAKLDSGHLSLETVPVEATKLLSETRDLFQIDGKAKNVHLDFQEGPALPVIFYGDPKRLRQILFNLVGNAMKFTRHGTVSVFADKLSYQDGREDLLLLVKDTGIGIPVHQQSKIFSEFFQSETSHSRQYGGTGLGLSITRHLVLLMGGTINFESTPGTGTTFRVCLPLTKHGQERHLKAQKGVS